MLLSLFFALGVLGTPQAPAAAQRPSADRVAVLVARLEAAAASGDKAAILALGAPGIDRDALEQFASHLTEPPPDRIVVNERDRAPLSGSGSRVILEVFSERGIEGRLGTWRVDVQKAPDSDVWMIGAVSRLSTFSGLFKLSVNPGKQYEIHNLVLHAPDLTLQMSSGTAFVADATDGPTAVVLLGRGRMHFAPPDLSERTQLRILNGNDDLVTEFDAVFLRIPPSEFEDYFPASQFRQRLVSPLDLRRGVSLFDDYIGRTLQLNLSDLSRDRWSITPPPGDVIAEVRTQRFGTLTYARSGSDAEDVTLFDRKRRRNISLYGSAEKLAERGRFYSEDDRTEYDVLAYEIEAEFMPERSFVSADARLKLKIRAAGTQSLTLRLAESLAVRGIYSPEFGPLLHLRVVGQNSLLISLPATLVRDTELWLDVIYSGRLPPQSFDREAVNVAQDIPQEPQYLPLEPRYLYSNRSYWYPQSVVTDYATAHLRITVPSDYDVVATGQRTAPPAPAPGVVDSQHARKMFVFDATAPVRYLACLISRFSPVDSRRIRVGTADQQIDLSVQANPRQTGRVRDMDDKAAAVFQYYASILGDAPYPSFTVAVTESDRPGGHSPPYFALLNQVVPNSSFVYRDDPVSFDDYPTFFLAHELAHQWWGQAVGWKNYHEQWISEGFAQYFAALYAEKERPGNVLGNLLRQMRKTAIDYSDQGPIYLGYRLGHIQGDNRVFRAIVYNKGAMVLHMLRRLVGDDTFFAGLRSFYEQWKFRKAGTDDFREAMQKASGRDLERFFETWVYGSSIPRVKFTYRSTSTEALLRFEQHGSPVDVPITVTITYANGTSQDVLVLVTDRTVEKTVPLRGPVRAIAANQDNGALVQIEK
jgi:hypothetical protein